MDTKNRFVTNSALHFDGTSWIRNKHLEIPLPSDDSSSGYGRSITPAAFRKMVSGKLVKLQKQFLQQTASKSPEELTSLLKSQTCAVEFGKESVLRILSQPDVVGLRFTFCLNDLMEESIIISGLIETAEIETVIVNGAQLTRNKTEIINKDAYREENLERAVTTLDDEKGVGKTYHDFLTETGISLDELLADDDKTVNKFTNGIFGIV